MLQAEERLWCMHQYLVAWRNYRGLSQEVVAEALGVRPSTISRWERGEMRLTTHDLERLASAYHCTITQLIVHPDAAEMVGRLDSAQEIMRDMDAETLEQWLSLGRKLAKK